MAGRSKEELIRIMDTIITELENEGLLDKYFRLATQLKEVNGPYFFKNLVLSFISDAQNALTEMTRLLMPKDEARINFEDIDQIAIKLKGCASCIGAIGISRACANLRRTIEVRSHIGCIQSKNEIQYEFERIHARLDVITQLEQHIVSR